MKKKQYKQYAVSRETRALYYALAETLDIEKKYLLRDLCKEYIKNHELVNKDDEDITALNLSLDTHKYFDEAFMIYRSAHSSARTKQNFIEDLLKIHEKD